LINPPTPPASQRIFSATSHTKQGAILLGKSLETFGIIEHVCIKFWGGLLFYWKLNLIKIKLNWSKDQTNSSWY